MSILFLPCAILLFAGDVRRSGRAFYPRSARSMTGGFD